MSLAQRIAAVKAELQGLVKAHEDGTYPEGPEALSARINLILDQAKLWEMRTVQVDLVGVLPWNREKSGLVAYDVQGLLFETFVENGFNPEKWDCVAVSVPPADKDEWLQFNQEKVQESDGLLPEINDMELATGRGSHGVSAMRACKFPCRSSLSEFANAAGNIAMGKIIDRQPSLRKPLEEGVPIKVLHGDVHKAIPGLFTLISRVGNVTNSHYRLQTTLQSCKRIHSIAAPMSQTESGIDWDKVGRLTAIGMHLKEAANVSKFCSFVQRWSGGPNGETLTNLELYEKSLHHKRSITADDLQLLADCDTEFERIIPAIINICIYFLHGKPSH